MSESVEGKDGSVMVWSALMLGASLPGAPVRRAPALGWVEVTEAEDTTIDWNV